MKKLFYFIFSVFLSYFLVLLFLDYSNFYFGSIESEITPIEIEKKSNMTNVEFINEIERICQTNDIDILYKKVNGKSEKSETEYYVTNFNNTFLYDMDNANSLENEGYISTKGNGQDCLLNGSTLFGDITIYKFNAIKKYNLNCSMFYLKDRDIQVFSEKMVELGYNVHIINEIHFVKKYVTVKSILMPAILFLITGCAFSLHKKKEFAVKKLNGYTSIDITKECIGTIIKNMLCISLVTFFLNIIIVRIYIDKSFLHYLKYAFPKIILFIMGALILFMLELEISAYTVNVKDIKNSNINREYYTLVILVQIMFLALGLLNIGDIYRGISKLDSIYKGAIESLRDINGFVSMPLNVSNKYIGDNNQLEYNKIMADFYNDTVNDFDGVLISTTNYRSINGEKTLAEQYGQLDITVNPNYLRINPIYDVKGDMIDSFPDDKLNIIVPETMKDSSLETYYLPYGATEKDINIIFMKENTEIKTYNPYSGDDGIIIDPVIYIYNEKYFWNQMMNYISGEYYLLKTKSADAYNEIYPMLEKRDLDELIPETPLVSNRFEESISYIKEDLLWSVIMMGINIIGIICSVLYIVKLFFAIFPKEIGIKIVMGYGTSQIYNKLLIHQFFCMLIVTMIGRYKSIPLIFPIVIFILQITFTIYFIKRFETIQINRCVKGGI